MTDTYDSDDCYDRSDRLEPQIINYDPEDPVPPFLRRPSSSSRGSRKSPLMNRSPPERSFQRGKVPPSAADQVLLNHFAPSRPDIAAYAAKNALFPSSDDESGPSSSPKQKPTRKEEPQPPEAPPASRELAKEVLKILYRNDAPAEDGGNDALHRQDRGGHDPSPSGPIDPTPETEPMQHVQELPPLKICLERGLFDDDISENSPLRKYAISPCQRSAQQVLPALQSPPQSATANPPENNNNHSLPSLQSAIGDRLSGIPLPKEPRIGSAPSYHFPIVPGSTPPLPRTDLVHERQLSGPLPPPQVPLSPFSHFSPASSTDLSNMPSPATQLPSWRNTFKPDIPHIPPNYEVPPHPSQMAQSPATGYPTPTDQICTVPEKVAHPTGSTQSTVSVPVGTFKCDHPGCTAPPFQTQYLLKYVLKHGSVGNAVLS